MSPLKNLPQTMAHLFSPAGGNDTSAKNKTVNDLMGKFHLHPYHGSTDLEMQAMNWAMYQGKHHFNISGARKSEVVDYYPMKGVVHRSKINVITTYTDIAVAKLLKQQPLPQATPMSADDVDKKTAIVGTAVLKNAYGQSKPDLTGRSYEALTLAKVQGTGWWKITWDETAGVNMGKDDSPNSEIVNSGDYSVATYDNTQVYPDPTATEYFNMQDVFHVYLANRTVISDLYSKELGDKTLTTYVTKDRTKNQYLWERFERGGYEQVLVTEYWSRPNKKYPSGRKVVILNESILVEDVDNPYAKYGDYAMPFFPFYWKKDADNIYGTCTFNDLVNIQKEINSLASLIMQSARKMASLKWFAPKGSGLKNTDLDGDIGRVIEYNPVMGQGISQGNPAQLPSYTTQHLNFLMGTVQDIEKIHEISMGQLPERGSQMSGSALKLLMDSEQVTHSPAMRRLKTTLKLSSEFILRLIRDKMDTETLVSIVGEGNEYAVEAFKTETDLNNNVDVMIQIGSAFDSSMAAKVEGSFNVWDRGIIQAAAAGDKAARQLLAGLEFGDVAWNNIEELTRARAYEDLKILQEEGKATEIYKYDDHAIYIEVYDQYRLTKDFTELEKDKQAAIIAALEARIELMQQQSAPPPEGAPGEGELPPGAAPPPEGVPQNAGAITNAIGGQVQ